MAARPALLVVVLHGDAEAVLSAAFDLPRQLGSAGLTLPEAFRVLPGEGDPIRAYRGVTGPYRDPIRGYRGATGPYKDPIRG